MSEEEVQYVNLVEIPMTMQDYVDFALLAYRPCICCDGLGYHITDILDFGFFQMVAGVRPCDSCIRGMEFVNNLN